MIKKEMKIKNKENNTVGASNYTTQNAITLIALVITIVILLILAGVTLNFTLGNKGIFKMSESAEDEYTKKAATEKINLKITNAQINTYAKEERMPTLQELADIFCEDSEIQYVELVSKNVASIDKITIGENKSFFTKLKEYPYEFEINSSLQLASINGVKIATNEQIPEGYIKPEGTIEITENGEHDVATYEKAQVNVPTYEKDSKVTITEKSSQIDVSNYQYADTMGLYTKKEYDDNYTLGYNNGEVSGWKKTTMEYAASKFHGSCLLTSGYIPKFIFIRCSYRDGTEVYWSTDNCNTFYSIGNVNTIRDMSKYFQCSSNGLVTIDWNTAYDYSLEIWTIK